MNSLCLSCYCDEFYKPHLPSAAVTFSEVVTEHFRQEGTESMSMSCLGRAVVEEAN